MKISLRDPLWQFISIVVAISIPIAFYFLQRNYKELSYEIVSATPLISKSKEIEGNLKIIYKDKTVDNIYLIIIKLINSGNVPINRNDYESPIVFSFNPNIGIIQADVIKNEPDSIKSIISIDSNKLLIEPLLLNESDSITFKVILSVFDGYIKADARIYGIKDIVFKVKGGIDWMAFFAGFFATLLGAIGTVIALFYTKVIVFVKNRNKIK